MIYNVITYHCHANLYKNNIIALKLYLFLKNKVKVRVTALNDLAYSWLESKLG
jgi:hypothetical protein